MKPSLTSSHARPLIEAGGLACLTALVVAVAAHAVTHAPRQTQAGTHCPSVVGTPQDAERSVGAVLAALRTEVPRAYANMTNQSGRGAWRSYIIRGLLALGPDRDPHAAADARQAASICGRSVADRSWAVLIDFPLAAAAKLGSS